MDAKKKYGIQAQRSDARHHERHGGRQSARPAGRSGLRPFIGLLLPLRGDRLPDPHLAGGGRTGGDVRRQAGRRLPLGGRSLRSAHGLSGHLAAMDRIDDLVPHGADLRRRVDRLHRIEPTCGHDPGVEQDLHAGGGAGHLLAGYLHLAQRSGLGRENQQMGRYDRHDHTRRTAHSAGHRLHRLGRSQPDGHVAGLLPPT